MFLDFNQSGKSVSYYGGPEGSHMQIKNQVLITHTARAGLFIFNLHRYVFYFQFAAQFLVGMYNS